MKNLPTFLVLWLLMLPSVHADEQITPNPNPAGNTITLDAPGWLNYTTFSNSGTIQIVANPLGGGTESGLKNYAGEAGAAILNNEAGGSIELIGSGDDGKVFFLNMRDGSELIAQLNNSGTIAIGSTSEFTNDGIVSNSGSFSNQGTVSLNLYSTFSNNIGGTFSNENDMTLASGSQVTGNLSNSGTFVNGSTATLTNGEGYHQ